jgi:DNA-binding NtrC family response regulator
MRTEDLATSELLELNSESGVIRFAGQRAIVIDALAMGMLRKYLVENFSVVAARIVLTQFGFAHGWRMAEAMKAEFKWDSDDQWQRAGMRIHELAGLFRIEPGTSGPLSNEGIRLAASYEAEQHLLHLGRSDVAVCWTISGLMSGYLSRSSGEDFYVLEDRCVGKGDPACFLSGRTRAQWGDSHHAELRVFEPSRLKECLDMSLVQVVETLKAAERKLRDRHRALVRAVPEFDAPSGIVAKSAAMLQVVELARRVAKVDSTVLITGESGAGKERIARLVHEESLRAGGPFIAINCGAVTETLLESELFGHARGAFTGAAVERAGLFEAANRGTLFLDEVGEVSPGMQVKLLRALQEREIRRVGENHTRRIDVRVVAATNRNLAQGVSGGNFRQDLYYRLKVVELNVPALRERREDILPLARLFLAEAALRMKRRISGLAPEVVDQLLRYEWTGNVRELMNAMERSVALARGTRVELEDLPEEVRHAFAKPVAVAGVVKSLESVERDYILAVMELNEGNQARTAEQLAIGSATLYRKLKSYGLTTTRTASRKVRGPSEPSIS